MCSLPCGLVQQCGREPVVHSMPGRHHHVADRQHVLAELQLSCWLQRRRRQHLHECVASFFSFFARRHVYRLRSSHSRIAHRQPCAGCRPLAAGGGGGVVLSGYGSLPTQHVQARRCRQLHGVCGQLVHVVDRCDLGRPVLVQLGLLWLWQHQLQRCESQIAQRPGPAISAPHVPSRLTTSSLSRPCACACARA